MYLTNLLLVLIVSLFQGPELGPKKVDETRVYFRVSDSNHILIRAKIQEKGPYFFILDTGAPVTFISEDAGKEIGLKADEKGWCRPKSILLEGGLEIIDPKVRLETPFQLKGMNGMGLAGVELHGLIGFDILAKYIIHLDISKNHMVWIPNNYTPLTPAGAGGKSAPENLETLGTVMKSIGSLIKPKPRDFVFIGNLGITFETDQKKLLVKQALPDSASDKAGLQKGDLITTCQGTPVKNLKELQKAILGQKNISILEMDLSREGKKQSLKIPLNEK